MEGTNMNARGNQKFNEAAETYLSLIDVSDPKHALHLATEALRAAGVISEDEYERIDAWFCF
jgi:hypothetical protein